MSRRVWVFAERSDLLQMLQRVERRTPLVYRQCFLDTADVPTWDSAAAIQDLGTASGVGKSYLILPGCVSFNLREVGLVAGGKKYHVDPFLNPDSITFQAGGVYEGECIVVGEFGTTAAKHQLFEAIRRSVQAEFRRVGDVYVGPGAHALTESGVRLVWNRSDFDRCRPRNFL
jgi:hypothetical protein